MESACIVVQIVCFPSCSFDLLLDLFLIKRNVTFGPAEDCLKSISITDNVHSRDSSLMPRSTSESRYRRWWLSNHFWLIPCLYSTYISPHRGTKVRPTRGKPRWSASLQGLNDLSGLPSNARPRQTNRFINGCSGQRKEIREIVLELGANRVQWLDNKRITQDCLYICYVFSSWDYVTSNSRRIKEKWVEIVCKEEAVACKLGTMLTLAGGTERNNEHLSQNIRSSGRCLCRGTPPPTEYDAEGKITCLLLLLRRTSSNETC